MARKDKKFYITTPLYYVNASPHIGHSYTQIATDTIARFHRLLGEDVFFMTGTDEHGEKIEKASLEAGFRRGCEKEFVDKIVPNFKKLWEDLNIEYDFFIRTTDKYHQETVRYILDVLYKKGDIYKGEYDGWFCVPCEMFWSSIQAPGGICPDCKRQLENIKESNYFFKLSKYQDWLIRHIEQNPNFIMPDYRKNEVLTFLKDNKLNDLCISRSKKRFQWGIELPFDREYITYVWIDALINYISGAGFPNDMERFSRLWPADIHLIGKDILRHHAVYWPIMLYAVEIEPPRTIFAHGWWTTKGEKMSKSKRNIVDPYYVIEEYGVDAYRYFLLREIPFGLDGNFSEEALIGRFNSDLANDLGNLFNRSLTMVEKYFNGVIPESKGEPMEYKKDIELLVSRLKESMCILNFSDALIAIWQFINIVNKSIEDKAPWKLYSQAKIEELSNFIYQLLEALRVIAITLYPFMPGITQKMWRRLGLKDFKSVSFKDIKRYGLIVSGSKTEKGPPLFPRIKR